MTHARAAKGGEYGANGEWYEGGKFIATKDSPKKLGSHKRAEKKQEIAPFKFEIAPSEGVRSIYAKWNSLWALDRATGKAVINKNLNAEYFGADVLSEAALWAQRWNNGERWA